MSARKTAEVLEIMQDTPKDAAYFQNAIKAAIDDFYFDNYGAETAEQIAKCSQNSFLAACVYANKSCINRDDLLTFIPTKVNEYSTIQNEVYDKSKVDILCTAYLHLCFLYEKIPSVFCFAELSGIDRTVLQSWISESKELTSRRSYDTPKRSILKLRDARGEMLQNTAISGGKGTIGSIAILNNTVWKNEVTEREEIHVLSAYDLPDLRRLSEIEESPRQQLPNFDSEKKEMEVVPDLSGVYTP